MLTCWLLWSGDREQWRDSQLLESQRNSWCFMIWIIRWLSRSWMLSRVSFKITWANETLPLTSGRLVEVGLVFTSLSSNGRKGVVQPEPHCHPLHEPIPQRSLPPSHQDHIR